jgi:hypothetical protein
MHPRRPTRTVLGAALLVVAVLAAGCGGSDGNDTTDEGSASTTVPADATPGLDDYSDDGTLDPTCGLQDFGGGLVLRKPCYVRTAHEPPHGVTLIEGSLFAYNGEIDIDTPGISGDLLLARDEAGVPVVIVTFNSDNLFAVNSSEVASPGTMDATIRLINTRWPNNALQVRGHTDATAGALASQRLSDARAAAAKAYLEEHGINAKEITAVGLGATQPLAKEDNAEARKFNRRVEIVLRIA